MEFRIAVELEEWDRDVPGALANPLAEVTIHARSLKAALQRLPEERHPADQGVADVERRLLDLSPGQGVIIRIRRLS